MEHGESVCRALQVEYVGIFHFVVEIITFTGTLTNASEYGEAGVLNRDVTDQFHQRYGFTNTRTTEQTNFTATANLQAAVDAGMGIGNVPEIMDYFLKLESGAFFS